LSIDIQIKLMINILAAVLYETPIVLVSIR